MSVASFFGNNPNTSIQKLPVNLTIAGGEALGEGYYKSVSGNFTTPLNNTGYNTVYTYQMQLPPINEAIFAKFTTIAKGGPVGNTNNCNAQETYTLWTITNGVLLPAAPIYFSNPNAHVGFAINTVGQNVVPSGTQILFQVLNSNVNQTTDWYWFIEIYSIPTGL